MPYLPSGTTFPSTVSTVSPGLASGGQDFVGQLYSSALQVTGVATAANLVTGKALHNFSGTATYKITTASPASLQVVDMFGKAADQNITVTGVVTISSAFGVKNFMLTTGNNYVAF
jgi:hypothetical protein